MKNKLHLPFLILIFFGVVICTYAQLPSAIFSIQSNACFDEKLNVTNASTNTMTTEWDFCEGDLFTAPSALSIGLLSAAYEPRNMDLINDGTNWFGFIVSTGTNEIYRVDFGTKIDNQFPSILNLGNISNLLDKPISIRVVQENGYWIGMLVNNSGPSLIRILFGENLSNATPLAEKLISSFTGNNGLAVSSSIAGKILVSTNINSNTITMVNFKDSFLNVPSGNDILTTIALTNALELDDIKILNYKGNWYGFVIGGNSRNILRLDFGSNLFSTPAVINVTGSLLFANGDFPTGITPQWDGGKFTCMIQSFSGQLYLGDFGADLLNTSPSYSNLGSLNLLSNSINLEVVKVNSEWFGFVIDLSNLKIDRFKFQNPCSANYPSSSLFVPPLLTYSQPGSYKISLIAKDQDNNFDYTYSSISVSDFQAPDIDFSSQNICSNNDVNFTSINQSGGITSYSWNFGDGGSSSSSTPAYIFSSAGNYNVTLTVTDGNNCQNTAQKPIQIFNLPQANFSLPSANPFCTNQNYVFPNTSTSDPGSNPTWQWSVNGTNVSTTQDLNYLFSSNSDQTIELTASIPGCSTQATQTVTSIQNGPLLSFTSPATSCVGTSVSFANNSTGSVLGYNWTFGDGNFSVQTSPSNAFASNGSYNVTLSASNAAGCQNSFSQPITIYSNPQPDFSLDLPPFSCAGSSSQFNDLTPALTDSNLSGWSWQFGDAASGSSSQRNPAYTYSTAADYNVTLQVTSNFGCTGTKQKTITISPSPQAIFTTSAACVNQSTQFTDASTGGVKSRQWKIQNSIFSSPTPTYTFLSSATYPVTLAVTGNNNCINQITQNVIVPVAPVMDFSVLYPCTGSPSQFQEVNAGGSDPATAWNWNFSPGSGSGNPANNSFSSAAVYPVTLTSTRQSKCIYSITKNVSIINGPVASFTPSVSAGAAPLNVLFTNNSSFADSYSWSFDDANNSTSTDTSPSFLFTQLGTYQVQLTASNALNCSNTVSAAVSVVIPSIDAIMSSLVLAEDPQTLSTRPIVTITNNSNVPLVDPLVIIDLGGDASLKEKISGTIQAGGTITRTLDLQILPKSIAYICAQVDVFNDVFSANNLQCVSLSQDEVALSPYPNPATTQMNIRWINAKAERVHVMIFKPNGQVAFDEEVDSPAGLSDFKLDTSLWGSGLYLVRITGGTSEKIYKVVIIN